MSLDMARVFSLFTMKRHPMLAAPVLNQCTPPKNPIYATNLRFSVMCGGDLYLWSVLVPLFGCVFASPLLCKVVPIVPIVSAGAAGPVDVSLASDRLPAVATAFAVCVLRLLLLLWGMWQPRFCNTWVERVCCALHGWVLHVVIPTFVRSWAATRFVPSFLDVFLVEYLLLECLCAAVASFALSRLNGRTFDVPHANWLGDARVQGGAFHYVLFCLGWSMLCLSPFSGFVLEWREAFMCALWVGLGYACVHTADDDVYQYAWMRSLLGDSVFVDDAKFQSDAACAMGIRSITDLLWLWLYRPVAVAVFMSALAGVVCDKWVDWLYVFAVSCSMPLTCACGLFVLLRLYASADARTGTSAGMQLLRSVPVKTIAMRDLSATGVGYLVGPVHRYVLAGLIGDTSVGLELWRLCTYSVGRVHKVCVFALVAFSNAVTGVVTLVVSALIVGLVCLPWTGGLASVRGGLYQTVADFEYWGGVTCGLLHVVHACVVPGAVLSQADGRAMLVAAQNHDIGVLAEFCSADAKGLARVLLGGSGILFDCLCVVTWYLFVLKCAWVLCRMGRRFSLLTIACVVACMLLAVAWVQSDSLQRSLADRLIGLLRWYVEAIKAGKIADQEGSKRAALGSLISVDLQDSAQEDDLRGLRNDADAAVICAIGRLCSVVGTSMPAGLLGTIVANHSQYAALPGLYALNCGRPTWATAMTAVSLGDLRCGEHTGNQVRWEHALRRARATKRTFELIEQYFVDPGHSNVIWTPHHQTLVMDVIHRQLLDRTPLPTIQDAPTAGQVLLRIASMDWDTVGEILFAAVRPVYVFGSLVQSTTTVEFWMNLVHQMEATEREAAEREATEREAAEREAARRLEAETVESANAARDDSGAPVEPIVDPVEPTVGPVAETSPAVPFTSCTDAYTLFRWLNGETQYCDPARYVWAYELRSRFG